MTSSSYAGTNTSPLGPYYENRAAAGPHSHWASFDLKLEGSRYHGLHVIVAAVPFDEESAEIALMEIEAFGHGFGWGQADSYLADTAGSSPGDPEAGEHSSNRAEILHDELYGSYADTAYFENVFKSEAILKQAAETPEALALVETLSSRVMNAFELGRDTCMEHAGAPAAPSRKGAYGSVLA